MIDEERVKELYHLAVYDAKDDKSCRQTGKYYMWDYVGKEMIKSFFSGSLAFIMLVVFAALGNLTTLTEYINSIDLLSLIIRLISLYVVFLALYLFATIIIYCVRYTTRRKRLRDYMNHLRKVRRMYSDREEL